MKKTLILLSLVVLNASSALATHGPGPIETLEERTARGFANGRRDAIIVETAKRCEQSIQKELARAHRALPGSVERGGLPGDPYLTAFAKGFTEGHAEALKAQTACNN